MGVRVGYLEEGGEEGGEGGCEGMVLGHFSEPVLEILHVERVDSSFWRWGDGFN